MRKSRESTEQYGDSFALEKDQGVYALRIRLRRPVLLAAGALPSCRLSGGTYWYIGSAQRNLGRRLSRHLRNNKRLHWHIDYLLARAETEVVALYTKLADKCKECETAWVLSLCGTPVPYFGSSDCRCRSHLFCTKGRRNHEAATRLRDLGFRQISPQGFLHAGREFNRNTP
ncbi:MAG: GIY-YIG nuclease family protein [Desulfohalobiaceae bacterium]|nr:GIY-YIG nuclease family protein [Desulfohalobiaceae bacterium]